jgi:hypothetical protein
LSEQLPPYITQRLDDQISWYGKKSRSNKFRFRLCQAVIIVASAAIPIINLGIPLIGSGLDQHALGISAILGGIITIVTALSQMDSYFETWVLYRTTQEALKREKFLYLNNAGDYYNILEPAKLKLLVERVEAMFSAENAKFLALQQNAKQRSDQQLNDMLQQQREINKQQRNELLELRQFKEQYQEPVTVPEVSERVELIRSTLSEIKFPTNKENIELFIQQNKSKIKDMDSISLILDKLPSKQYINLKEIESELVK